LRPLATGLATTGDWSQGSRQSRAADHTCTPCNLTSLVAASSSRPLESFGLRSSSSMEGAAGPAWPASRVPISTWFINEEEGVSDCPCDLPQIHALSALKTTLPAVVCRRCEDGGQQSTCEGCNSNVSAHDKPSPLNRAPNKQALLTAPVGVDSIKASLILSLAVARFPCWSL
jgi:hypothetical protein